jgi:hypothetical protein
MTVHMQDETGAYAGLFAENPNRDGWAEVTEPPERAIGRLNEDFAQAMKQLQTGWPDYEVATWSTQAAEAKAWAEADEGAKPATPFLTTLHLGRAALGWQEDFASLVDKVLRNTELYTQGTGRLIAARHFAERAIQAATDAGSITWDFSLKSGE